MPEPVFFMRGFPPPLEAILTDPIALADLKAVSALSEDNAKALQDRLAKTRGFLDPESLSTEIREVVGDEDTANSIRRVLDNLKGISSGRVLTALKQIREQNKKDFPLDESELTKLKNNLAVLKKRSPALVRFDKAKRLATLTGQQLESVDIVCDLRPIFDQERKAIEGMMPYSRLRVVATGADGLPKPFEVELTWQQVHELSDKASKAAQKLIVLNLALKKWMPDGIPNLPLTRPPEND